MTRRFRLFAVCCAIALATPATAAEPQWIWGVKDANKSAPPGMCYFRKKFNLAEPESGRIEITCDNRYVLRLNGRLVGASTNWQVLERYDVSPLLQAGENVVDVQCTNDGDAAGLAVRIVAKSKGQDEEIYSTDASWETRLNVGKSWNPAALAEIKPVTTFVLGELGKTAPWGNGLKPSELIVRTATRDDISQPFELYDGDRVVLLGNTFIEREQKYGYIETALTAYWPKRDITFRNLGWSGDTVTGIARARFGDANEGFRHLTEHVFALKPTVIFIGYGTNESFAGAAGLDQFGADLVKLLDVLQQTGARIVFLSPLRLENLGPPLLDPMVQNENIARYAAKIRELAAERGCRYVDLDAVMFSVPPREKPISGVRRFVTDNGMHLSMLGYLHAGGSLRKALGLKLNSIRFHIDTSARTVQADGAQLSGVELDDGYVSFIAQDDKLAYPSCTPVCWELPPTLTWSPEGGIGMSFGRLTPGTYELKIDGKAVTSSPIDTSKTAGVSMTHHLQDKRWEALRQTIVKKNELYFHRWRPQNETYLYLFRKHEQGNNAREIPEFDPLIEKLEAQIAELRVPKPYRVELKRVK